MRIPLLLLLFTACHASAIPASTTLVLVNEPGFNRIQIRISAEGVPSNDTTTLSGSVEADFNIDPTAHTTSEMTLRDGRVNATNMRFRGRVLIITVYDINLRNLSGTVRTLDPPGTVDPATGQFDASQHVLILDQGQISGTALGESFEAEFTPENPVGGPGTGTGTVTLTPTGSDATHQRYDVVVTLPVVIDQSGDLDGVAIEITGSGTIKAVGTLSVPKSEFIAWTLDQGVAGTPFDAPTAADTIPAGLRWAIGLDATEPAASYLPQPPATGGPAVFSLALRASRAPVWIEESTDLDDWQPVPDARLSSGENPLPAGSDGTFTASPAPGDAGFLRMRAAEP